MTNSDITKKASLITRLNDAIELYDEPIWREIQDILTSPEPSAHIVQEEAIWYRRDSHRLAREKTVLGQILAIPSDWPDIFYIQKRTGNLGVSGLLKCRNGKSISIEMIYPDDYPNSPPKVYLTGPWVKKNRGLFRADRSVPVPGPRQEWNGQLDGSIILTWTLQWLEEVANIV